MFQISCTINAQFQHLLESNHEVLRHQALIETIDLEESLLIQAKYLDPEINERETNYESYNESYMQVRFYAKYL